MSEQPTVTWLTHDQLRQRRATALASTGLPETRLRALAAEWKLTALQVAALDAIDECDFLLGVRG